MILLEHGPGNKPAVFRNAREWITRWRVADVPRALQLADEARRDGAWIAGYLAYEAGYAFERKLGRPLDRLPDGPLVALGVFDGPEGADPVLAQAEQESRHSQMTPPEPLITRADYDRAICRVQDYIAAGDCYQINLTFPMTARITAGTPLGLYGALRRTGAVGHGAYVDTEDADAPVIISRSPELFFRVDASGRIVTRPMKGTRPRGANAVEDAAIMAELQGAEKDRAENLMIVDLLRNDISRMARVGSVKVPALYEIETYATVHQMTSTVEGMLEAPPDLAALMAALFPCGSVTGAPKVRAMEIIRELEPQQRGVYCGTVGWMAPDGRADFSVAIRTLSAFGQEIVMNVGGAVVHGSTAQGEWEEALWKARFVKAAVSRG